MELPGNAADAHKGHRARLRASFLAGGGKGMHDYQLLELLLAQAIPRKDVKRLARDLITKYRGLSRLLDAPIEALQREAGLGEHSVVLLKLVPAMTKRMLRSDLQRRYVLADWDRLLEYCLLEIGQKNSEELRTLFLDNKYRLIADECLALGTVNAINIPMRVIIQRAIEIGAAGLILVHVHPSGDVMPSEQDISFTHRLRDVGRQLDVPVHDHIIVSQDKHFSFRHATLL